LEQFFGTFAQLPFRRENILYNVLYSNYSYMAKITTVQVQKKVLRELKKAKKYPRQTYSELISELLRANKARQGHYDKFLHVVQQEKMKELWDNNEDKEWEDA